MKSVALVFSFATLELLSFCSIRAEALQQRYRRGDSLGARVRVGAVGGVVALRFAAAVLGSGNVTVSRASGVIALGFGALLLAALRFATALLSGGRGAR